MKNNRDTQGKQGGGGGGGLAVATLLVIFQVCFLQIYSHCSRLVLTQRRMRSTSCPHIDFLGTLNKQLATQTEPSGARLKEV